MVQAATIAERVILRYSAGLPDLTPAQWLLAALGALGVGFSKAGLAGIGLLHIVIFAFLFGARDSTGVVLPMLLAGDVTAVTAFHQHARWDYIRRMLPPACLGVMLAASVMRRLDDALYKPVIGWIILVLAALQILRMWRPTLLGNVPHSRSFAWISGCSWAPRRCWRMPRGRSSLSTRSRSALPKLEIVGTSAWFFLLINAFKVPFSFGLGLIHGQTLLLNLLLVPGHPGGRVLRPVWSSGACRSGRSRS